MNWETYTAFGDSITIGARTYLGYPEMVGNTLSHHLSKQWNVINHSVSGFRAIDLARHIDAHFTTLRECKPSISTILIGTNDIKQQTTLADFTVALSQIILKTKLLTVNGNVILLSIPEFHKGIMYPYSIGMNETIVSFNTLIAQLGCQHNVRTMTIAHTETDFSDGVHLNCQGIATFSNQIVQYILRDKGIEIS